MCGRPVRATAALDGGPAPRTSAAGRRADAAADADAAAEEHPRRAARQGDARLLRWRFAPSGDTTTNCAVRGSNGRQADLRPGDDCIDDDGERRVVQVVGDEPNDNRVLPLGAAVGKGFEVVRRGGAASPRQSQCDTLRGLAHDADRRQEPARPAPVWAPSSSSGCPPGRRGSKRRCDPQTGRGRHRRSGAAEGDGCRFSRCHRQVHRRGLAREGLERQHPCRLSPRPSNPWRRWWARTCSR